MSVNYYVHSPSPMWYGEGDDMILIDGDEKPTLHGTGTEDYFNTSWCPKTLYSHPYYGYARVNDNCMTLDLASVAYWYPAPPLAKLPPIPDKEVRKHKSFISESDIHKWRDAWRKTHGGGDQLWGNER